MSDAAVPSRAIALVPNVLSVARIGLAAAFPAAAPPWRLVVVFAAALSDLLDGMIARSFNVTSAAGGLLDAVADKLFVLTALVTLVAEGALAWWIAVLVVSRDVAVALVALYAALRREWSAFQRMPASRLGKVTTCAQFALFVCLLIPLREHYLWIAVPAAGVSAVAAIDYLGKLIRAELARR